MKVGIFGTGDVGQSLAKGFLALGNEVKIGSRTANNEKGVAFAKSAGAKASAGSFADAAGFGEIICLATLGTATEAAIDQAGVDRLRGKVIIDATNPLDMSHGFPPTLAIRGDDSLGERVQRLAKEARVVKAFNTVGNAHFFQPSFPGGPPDMFIAGNDREAKKTVERILKEFGWATVDVGSIESSRYLEAMCMAWVLVGAQTNTWNHAFKLLRK